MALHTTTSATLSPSQAIPLLSAVVVLAALSSLVAPKVRSMFLYAPATLGLNSRRSPPPMAVLVITSAALSPSQATLSLSVPILMMLALTTIRVPPTSLPAPVPPGLCSVKSPLPMETSAITLVVPLPSLVIPS